MRPLSIWPPPATSRAAAFRAPHLPYPLEHPGARLYGRAREALRRCLPAIGLRPGDEVLVPSYHHGSEVEAVLAAGLRVCGYEPAGDLQPDEAELDRLVGPRTRALHLIHYLGFPQDSARWRAWCDSRGLLLVEDAAQAWRAERDGVAVGTHGDLAVFCLYKSLGLPDGAVAVSRQGALPGPEGRGGTGLLHLAKPFVRIALDATGRERRAREYDQVADIAVPDRSVGPALASRWLLPRAVTPDLADRRRQAFRHLLSGLGHLVPAPFTDLPPGASPFVFPVQVADKAAALSTLARHGIVGLDLWRLPHPAVPAVPGGVAWRLRREVVGLPVHQYLTADELDRVLLAARELDVLAVGHGVR